MTHTRFSFFRLPVIGAGGLLALLALSPHAAKAQQTVTTNTTDNSGTYNGITVGTANSPRPTLDFGGSAVDNGSLDNDYTSTANVSGGYVHNLNTHDGSTANVSGGSIQYGVDAYNASTINVSGGDIYYEPLVTHNTSTVNVTGGQVVDLEAYDASTIDLSGGGVSGIVTENNSTANTYGGTIYGEINTRNGSTANVFGGSIGSGILTFDTSTVNLYGTFYAVNPATDPGEKPLNDGKYTSDMTFYAVLADNATGESLDYVDQSGGQLVLNAAPAPEPSQMALFALTAAGLGGLMLRARKGTSSERTHA